MNILLIEDEKGISDALVSSFKREKWTTTPVYDGEEGLEYALTGIYDIILLDVMLPSMNGWTVLSKLREKKVTTPVLMMTALSQLSDKLHGLNGGADDYLAKPFETPELIARIKAILRRRTDVINEDEISYGDVTLNISSYELRCEQKAIKVSVKEFDIMRYFLSRPRFVVTKDELILKLWGYDSEAEYNNIEVYISFLRKKLAFIGAKTSISTVRGAGYKLEANV